jgi:hypothetical protein
VYGSARLKPGSEIYEKTREIANLIGKEGFNIITGGGPGPWKPPNLGAMKQGLSLLDSVLSCLKNRSAIFTPTYLGFNHFLPEKFCGEIFYCIRDYSRR